MAKERGVSEIVSQILMILLVVSIGTIILTYSMGYFSGLAGASDLMTKMNSDTLKERFLIVNVNVTGVDGIGVAVYNYGQQSITIDGLYVAMDDPIGSTSKSLNIARTTIQPGEFKTIYGNYGEAINAKTIRVRVVSTLGNYYENVYAGPVG